jgi:hypothetical protein
MKKRWTVLILCLVTPVSFAAGWLVGLPDRFPVKQLELMDAALWWNDGACVAATGEERERFEMALRVLDVYGNDINSLSIGAEKFLATAFYRRHGSGAERYKNASRVCPPDGLYRRVADVMARHDMWQGRGRLTEYHLELAWRIGEARPEIIEAVASVAFNETPQRSDLFSGKDIRPLARAVLASFGPAAAPYGDQAFAQISAEDAMGTGAAQVAVAAGHARALEKAASLMNGLLAILPEDEPVPWDKRNRLYELAHAIAFAGEAGRDHVAPLLALMKRKVQSWAPPFGMIELDPKRMCAVLERTAPDYVSDYPYCADDSIPLER